MLTEKEFNKIFEKYNKPLVFFAKSMVGDLFAEDVVADVFVHTHVHYDGSINIKTYLYNRVQWRCYDLLKKDRKRSVKRQLRHHISYPYISCGTPPPDVMEYIFKNSEDQYSADAKIIKSELLAEISEKIKSLSETQKRMFELMFIEDLPDSTAATICDIKRVTANKHKNEIIRIFKEMGVFLNRRYYKTINRTTLVLVKKYIK